MKCLNHLYGNKWDNKQPRIKDEKRNNCLNKIRNNHGSEMRKLVKLEEVSKIWQLSEIIISWGACILCVFSNNKLKNTHWCYIFHILIILILIAPLLILIISLTLIRRKRRNKLTDQHIQCCHSSQWNQPCTCHTFPRLSRSHNWQHMLQADNRTFYCYQFQQWGCG